MLYILWVLNVATVSEYALDGSARIHLFPLSEHHSHLMATEKGFQDIT